MSLNGGKTGENILDIEEVTHVIPQTQETGIIKWHGERTRPTAAERTAACVSTATGYRLTKHPVADFWHLKPIAPYNASCSRFIWFMN